ncbi:MAG TPA: sigma-70 family RNA polymerase sigma factor [Opitutaceae bacterium]|nr:sigma-70 family RNA polymerase sigma factor [Opitutaceae bacterium]
MPTDSELLRVYAETRSEEAFKELVLRHHRMVYFAALRRLNGDAHRAQEVAQDVFADLARKSASLAARPVINGWLYVSACYGAAKVARAAQRKRAAEEKAAAEQLSALSNGDIASADLSLVLDDILLKLNPADREAVLLRYFQGLTFSEMAGKLKLSEDGARLRLNRAIERMRSLLTKRGLTSSAAALSGVLASHAQISAPVNLASAVAAGALEQIAGANLSAIYIFTMTKSTVTLACAAVLIGTIPAVYYLRNNLSEGRSSSVIGQSTAVPHDSSARRDGTRSTPPRASVPASSSAAAATASTAPLNASEQPAPASADPRPR